MADAKQPEIDDPEDIQDAALRAWMRHAPDFRDGRQTYVIGRDVLPPRWKALQRPVTSLESAKQIVHDATRHGLDPNELRALCKLLPLVPDRLPSDEMNNQVAAALSTGELWILKKNSRPAKGRADPAVFAQLNGAYGTNIDFDFLAAWEGGQYLHGYIPFTKGVVAGNSGMTIATGFDIGQKSASEIKKMAISAELADKLDDFAGHKFKGMSRAEVITAVANLKAPVPVITKEEADLLDKLVHAEHIEAAVAAWNGARKTGVPAFRDLPEPWQTVLFSRFFHQGKGANHTTVIKTFWTAATSGKWQDAVTALRNYPVTPDWYKSRVTKEADHLATRLPPALKPAVAPGTNPAAPGAPPALPGMPPAPPIPPKL